MSNRSKPQPTNVDYLIALLCGFWPAQSALSESLGETCKIEETYFISIESSVDALSQCYHQISISEDREFMAAILQSSGLYQVRVTAGSRGRNKISLSFSRRKNQKIVALWHTHGAQGFARNYFSPTDTALSNQLDVPFYLTDPDGIISRFDPGGSVQKRRGHMVRDRRERTVAGSALGMVVGSVTVSLEVARITENFKTIARAKNRNEDDF